MSARLPVLDRFIADLRAIWAENPQNKNRMEQAKPLLEKFVMEPSLKTHSANWPSTEGHKNLLLYVDPDHDLPPGWPVQDQPCRKDRRRRDLRLFDDADRKKDRPSVRRACRQRCSCTWSKRTTRHIPFRAAFTRLA